MSVPFIFLFPGQSSRDSRMFDRAREAGKGKVPDPEEWASEYAERPIDPAFGTNTDVQLAVFSVSLQYLELLIQNGITPSASAGLSLGEYAHLVAIGALEPDDAMHLVAARGRAYDLGPDGKMVAVQPVCANDAQAVVDEVRAAGGWSEDDLGVSNDNSPGQCVVSGAAGAVEAFVEAVEETLFAQCAVIERRIPMHTGRFRPVVERLYPALDDAPWKTAHQAYWPNVTAQPVRAEGPDDVVPFLARHVYSPVLWRQTINALDTAHPDAIFIEVGPRTVLRDMMTRRWIAKDRVMALDPFEDRSGFHETLEVLAAHAD